MRLLRILSLIVPITGLVIINAVGQVPDTAVRVGHEGMWTTTTLTKEPIVRPWQFAGGTATFLSFSGLNATVTAEAKKGRHMVYAGPKISVAQKYLFSSAPLGFVTGYKVFIHENPSAGSFNFFLNLDYQLQYHKAFRTSTDLPKKFNKLHELNVGYGLQYNISRKFAVNNVLGFGRYLEVFNNPRTGSKTNFDGWNRVIRVQFIYTFN